METRYPTRIFLFADLLAGVLFNQSLPKTGELECCVGEGENDEPTEDDYSCYSWFEQQYQVDWEDGPFGDGDGDGGNEGGEDEFNLEDVIRPQIIGYNEDEEKFTGILLEEFTGGESEDGPPDLVVGALGLIHAMAYDDEIELDEYIRETLWDDIEDIKGDERWRQMDDIMTRISDAQMGKVMTDRHWNRVRMEEYILRPAPKTVQFLSINLRGNSAGDLRGLTTLDWRTNFNSAVSNFDLKNLPWQDYLTTHGESRGSHIEYSKDFANYPKDIKITLLHGNSSEGTLYGDFLFEFTKFGERKIENNKYRQPINYSILGMGSGEFNLDSWDGAGFIGIVDNLSPEINKMPGGIEDSLWGFTYTFPAEAYQGSCIKEPFLLAEVSGNWNSFVGGIKDFRLTSDFYVIDDDGPPTLTGIPGIKITNIRDALCVGFFELPSETNLEMSFTLQGLETNGDVKETNLFNAPIDIVIAPAPMAVDEEGTITGGDSRWKWNEFEWGE